MKNPLILPIFFYTEKTKKLSDLEIDYDLRESELRDMYFYEISALSEYHENEEVYTQIHSNGDTFICPYDIIKVQKLINENLKIL